MAVRRVASATTIPTLRPRAALPWHLRCWRTAVRFADDFERRQGERAGRGVRWFEDDPLEIAGRLAQEARALGTRTRAIALSLREERGGAGWGVQGEAERAASACRAYLGSLETTRASLLAMPGDASGERLVVGEALDRAWRDVRDALLAVEEAVQYQAGWMA